MVAVVVVALVWYFGRRDRWDWGDVPTWVGAVATVMALGAAGVAAFFAAGQLRILRDQVKLQDQTLKLQAEQLMADRKEADRRAEQELKLLKVAARRQAELVVVKSNRVHVFLDNAPYNMMVAVQIDNESPRPVRNIVARVDIKPYSRKPYGWCDVAKMAGAATVHRSPLSPLSTIRAAEGVALIFPVQQLNVGNGSQVFAVWDLDPDERISDTMLPGVQMSDPLIDFVVRFTDDAVQHWELTGDMQLTQIPDRNDW
ncbi:hypothetical protein [Catenulispora rubra]|uniref:hypothetical protein n=1 Tax=Catenulispora rubra TaxID=280293 RepID=UPI001891FE41|nr:hypothetical protein [Catenulispora rubra]